MRNDWERAGEGGAREGGAKGLLREYIHELKTCYTGRGGYPEKRTGILQSKNKRASEVC
jgi:hypothetical protein